MSSIKCNNSFKNITAVQECINDNNTVQGCINNITTVQECINNNNKVLECINNINTVQGCIIISYFKFHVATPSEYITVQGVGSGLLVVKALT